MAVKTCILQKYAKYDFKSNMYPERPKKNVYLEIGKHLAQHVCRAMIMKLNQHQMVESPTNNTC